jgi:membrane protein
MDVPPSAFQRIHSRPVPLGTLVHRESLPAQERAADMQRVVRFAKDVVNGWLNAEAFTLAAALAYYAIFAIAPLLLISIHIASLFFDRTAAIEGLTRELSGVVGPTGSDAIRQMLEAAGTARPEGWAGLVAIAVLIFAAGGFVGSLQAALDKIWDAPPRPSDIWAFLKGKLFSFSLVLGAAFLLLISLVLSTLMTALAGRITAVLGLPEGMVQTVITIANFLLSALIFAAIFKFVPSVGVSWWAAILGGVFTAILFAAGRLALAWYLGREAEASAYGAATSLVLLLIWVYYSAQILFLGAQFAQSLQSAPQTTTRPLPMPEATGTYETISSEQLFWNVVGAVALGFLFGAAIAQRPSRRSQPRVSLLQAASALLPQLSTTGR